MLDRSRSIVQLLIADEGWRNELYQDSKKLWTIGVGHLLEPGRGRVSDAVVELMLEEDIAEREAGLDARLPWWRGLSPARRDVLLSMAFQMGVAGVLGFRRALLSAEAGDFITAERELLNSDWARIDSPARARRLAAAFKKG